MTLSFEVLFLSYVRQFVSVPVECVYLLEMSSFNMGFISISTTIFGLLALGQLNIFCAADPIATASNTLNAVVCGDNSWSFFYNVDKCIKLIPQLANFYEAARLCRELIGISDSEIDENAIPLITIRSAEEQEAVVNLLFDQWKIPGDVWLGAVQVRNDPVESNNTKSVNKFVWPDKSPLEYTNWAPNPPPSLSFQNDDNNCSQISYSPNPQNQERTSQLNLHQNPTRQEFPSELGLWQNQNCELKQNYVLCQKPGDWRFIQIQKALNTLSKSGVGEEIKSLRLNQNSMKNTIENLLDQQDNLKNEVNTLKSENIKCQNQLLNGNILPKFQSLAEGIYKNFSYLESTFDILQFEYNYLLSNPVPIGFVYLQLPNTLQPSLLWPTVTWSQITSDYQNLFLRVEGEKSGFFGSIQNEQIRKKEGRSMGTSSSSNFMIPVSPLLTIPLFPRQMYNPLNFVYKTPFHPKGADEVRPINTAIRVWKRVA